MSEEIQQSLAEELLRYRGAQIPLGYVMAMLRQHVLDFLHEQNLDPTTYTTDQITCMVVTVMCEESVHIS